MSSRDEIERVLLGALMQMRGSVYHEDPVALRKLLAADGYVVVPSQALAELRDEAQRESERYDNPESDEALGYASFARDIGSLLAAHTDTAPSTDDWIIRGPWENFRGDAPPDDIPREQAIEVLMGHGTTGFDVARHLGGPLFRKARFRLLYYQTAEGERRRLYATERIERPDDAVALTQPSDAGA